MKSTHIAPTRTEQLDSFVVTAQQMQQIEARVFAAGLPVAALMEKAGGLLSQWIMQWIRARYPQPVRVGLLVGSGHNGGDALVVARELHLAGQIIYRYQPLQTLKELTQAHAQYADSLGIPASSQIADLQPCDLIIDGLFGVGLTRPLSDELAQAVNQLNAWAKPVISIDLPSGIQTDTGAVLGAAVQASHTLCLGLWKQAFLQDAASDYMGASELIDIGLPLSEIQAVLGASPSRQRITPWLALSGLPLPRPATTHKYKQGHLLLICGSRCYMGAAVLAGLAARASGVGMLSIAVPETLRLPLIAQLPDAIVIGCPETPDGAISKLLLPDLTIYQTIACGPGLTREALPVVQQVLDSDRLLLLDADGLNALATLGIEKLKSRRAVTVLTPHEGEFKRLFPTIASVDRIELAQTAAQQGAILLLKGAKTVIASPNGCVWLNPNSTPALARGGSGDVLTGLMGGLLAQAESCGIAPERAVISAAWWHAQAGLLAAQQRTELGVDAATLAQFLIPALAEALKQAETIRIPQLGEPLERGSN